MSLPGQSGGAASGAADLHSTAATNTAADTEHCFANARADREGREEGRKPADGAMSPERSEIRLAPNGDAAAQQDDEEEEGMIRQTDAPVDESPSMAFLHSMETLLNRAKSTLPSRQTRDPSPSSPGLSVTVPSGTHSLAASPSAHAAGALNSSPGQGIITASSDIVNFLPFAANNKSSALIIMTLIIMTLRIMSLIIMTVCSSAGGNVDRSPQRRT